MRLHSISRRERRWKFHSTVYIILKKKIADSIDQKKQTTIMVDAGDKNCLAELTVALKPNQGVRQWPYIIAGVLFFRDFILSLSKDSFAQAKERT